MVSSRVIRAAVVVLFLFGLPVASWARQAAPPAPTTAERGPFTKNVIGVELGAGLLTEAWNLNGTREWIGDGSFALWWAFTEGKALVVEFHAAGIAQAQPRAAFVNGIMPIFRCRVLNRGRSTMFIELGAGLSWSDTVVPPRGTRFNYMIVTSGGLTRRLTNQVHAVASVRLLHLSNASLMGPNHNPDIESLGGYFGVFMGF